MLFSSAVIAALVTGFFTLLAMDRRKIAATT
jgi:hypothetical protein